MKIAIVCDWLVTLAGAEKVLIEILNCFPEADLFAVCDFLNPTEHKLLHDKKITTTFIQHLPWAKRYYRNYLPLMPLAIEQLDVTSYDVVISSAHAVAKGVITSPEQIHISYVHSPMRYAWDLQFQYLKETGLAHKRYGYLVRYLLHKMRNWDQHSANRVDYFLANSAYIAKRIEKTYRRSATVIYPPVATDEFTLETNKKNYYLAASRFVPYKKMDLIVESFAAMPDKELIVIGDGPDFAKAQAKAAQNVTLLGRCAQPELIRYMQHAKAFIFAAEEDFGIAPVEAQACGTPVIAFGRGGALETIRGLDHSEPTGLFFNEQSIPAITQAVTTFEQLPHPIKPEDCRRNAERFAAERFRREFGEFVNALFPPLKKGAAMRSIAGDF